MRLSFMLAASTGLFVFLLLTLGTINSLNPNYLGSHTTVVALLNNSFILKDLIQKYQPELADSVITSEDLLSSPTPINDSNFYNVSASYEIFGIDYNTLTTSTSGYFFNVFSTLKAALGLIIAYIFVPTIIASLFNFPLIASLLITIIWLSLWTAAIIAFVRSGVI